MLTLKKKKKANTYRPCLSRWVGMVEGQCTAGWVKESHSQMYSKAHTYTYAHIHLNLLFTTCEKWGKQEN